MSRGGEALDHKRALDLRAAIVTERRTMGAIEPGAEGEGEIALESLYVILSARRRE